MTFLEKKRTLIKEICKLQTESAAIAETSLRLFGLAELTEKEYDERIESGAKQFCDKMEEIIKTTLNG